MKCEIIRDLLPLYIENLCSLESRTEIEAHLEHCQDCQHELELLRQEYTSRVDTQNIDGFLAEKDLLIKSKEEIRDSFADKLTGKIFTVLFALSLVINVAMLVLTFVFYQYRYPRFYFDELGTAQIYILLFPFLPTLLALAGRILLRKSRKHKIFSRILLAGMIPAMLYAGICTLAFILIPPVHSATDNPAHYMELDGESAQKFENAAASFYPQEIPEHAEQIHYDYERYSSIFTDSIRLEASWSLPSDEYETVKQGMLMSRPFCDGGDSENTESASMMRTIYPEKITITFEYDDSTRRVTYRAYCDYEH